MHSYSVNSSGSGRQNKTTDNILWMKWKQCRFYQAQYLLMCWDNNIYIDELRIVFGSPRSKVLLYNVICQ